MAFLRPDLVLAEKALAIGGLVALFGGFAALIYGEFAPSVGFQGLVDQGIGGAGFLAMGAGVLCFVPLVARDPWRARPRTSEGRRMARRKAAREACIIALNLVCYVGTALVALGALTALDRAPIAAGATFVLCIATFLLYRRHRKRNRQTYELIKPIGIVLVMLAFSAAAATAGGLQASRAAADTLEGPRKQTCVLSGFDEHRPTGRFASLSTAELVVEFIGEDGQSVRLSIKEQDRAVLRQIVDANGIARITYYPRTGVFVDAEPLGENRATDGISGAS